MSTEGEDLVAAIRSTDGPFEVSVSGMSAELVDTKDALFAKLPIAAAIIALVTFAVLFLQFGSVVIPIKAVILNLLSLSATLARKSVVEVKGGSSRLDYSGRRV